MRSVLTIGDVVCDLIAPVTLPVLPDQVIMTERLRFEPGGVCNFAIMARRLGLIPRVIGACGADIWGDHLLAMLRDESIDTGLIRQATEQTTTVVLVLADTAAFTQTYISAPFGGSRPYPADDATIAAALDSVDALYLSGYTLREDALWPITERLLQVAAGRLPIYLDPGPLMADANLDRQAFALAHVDVILATEDELRAIDPGARDLSFFNHLLKDRVHTLVIKRNVAGCRIVTKIGAGDFAAYPVAAIGASAAGDAFNAGFIVAQLRGFNIDDAAQIANAVGAAKVQRLGGGRNVPHLSDVRQILAQNSVQLSLEDWDT